MLSKCRASSVSSLHFKRQLSGSPNLSSAFTEQSKHYPSLLATLPTTSKPILELTHFKDFHSDHSFCSHALKVSASWPKFRFLQKGKQTHAHTIKLGLHNKLSLQNQILHVYVKCNKFDDTEKLFDEMLVKNVVTWNTVICGVLGCDFKFKSSPHLGIRYFKRMLLCKVGLDQITFNGLLRACVEIDDIEMGWQLHCFILKLGFDLNCFVSSALVDLYGKCGSVEDARRVFNEVVCRDLVLWNVMVSCYALNCLTAEAFRVFDLMLLEGQNGDEFTFSSLLNACGTLGSSELGRQIHGLIIKQLFDSDVSVASALVDMYAKSGNIDDAGRVFDAMTTKNLVSWNTMIVGYGKHGDGKEAMRLLRDMFRRNFYPDDLTLASILSSCGDLSIICETMQVHAYVVKYGFQAFLSVGNALIKAYSKCGSIASAFKCFSSVADPDLVTWTSMIGATAFHGLSGESIAIFERMLSSGIRPDKIAFLGVLSACSHGGLVNEGLHYFNLMINDYQIMPDSEHYTCLIDHLARAGLLHEAYDILASMPIEPRSDTLGAFIGACRVYGEAGLAKWAAEKLFHLEPDKPVNYTLVSNLYASEGYWSDVVRVRKKMRDNCNYKVPGCSWMESASSNSLRQPLN
ncbi:pentatricopeptide repeat-containing protein At2g46050, mitochondrial [Mangifera indica]|uniref:pentatricopeptide repeat-containing protein At2g46050, mitochondrial n=1 Tax=Mangifera indica TaxID=29780 RepID=UPI001CFC04E1|nr:pentatricopeptide repeat-containing protein At2g46050, mitochondrial [Mangifera indica]